ncbi:hypothetical protein [Caudoviricetes sp.]|nr:hypothetical protein [Caudoviricetes sp.]
MNIGKLYTTLNKIREHHPCRDGWEKLLDHLNKTKADDEPLSFLTILESNGLNDALWCLRAAPEEWMPDCRMYAVWCAKQVEHLITDQRSKDALVVAQNHALGKATNKELVAARDAAWAAARDAWEAASAPASAAAARDAWEAARAAWAAARAAAWEAAWEDASARDAQKEMFIKMCQGTAPWQVREEPNQGEVK